MRKRAASIIPIGTRFTVLHDFDAPETASTYLQGLGYTVQNEKLGVLVKRWIKEGKVKLGGDTATLVGHGG